MNMSTITISQVETLKNQYNASLNELKSLQKQNNNVFELETAENTDGFSSQTSQNEESINAVNLNLKNIEEMIKDYKDKLNKQANEISKNNETIQNDFNKNASDILSTLTGMVSNLKKSAEEVSKQVTTLITTARESKDLSNNPMSFNLIAAGVNSTNILSLQNKYKGLKDNASAELSANNTETSNISDLLSIINNNFKATNASEVNGNTTQEINSEIAKSTPIFSAATVIDFGKSSFKTAIDAQKTNETSIQDSKTYYAEQLSKIIKEKKR